MEFSTERKWDGGHERHVKTCRIEWEDLKSIKSEFWKEKLLE